MANKEKITIKLNNLKFDAQNPRLPMRLQGVTDENKVIDYMVKYGNVTELMLSIGETGYSEAEPLLVVKEGTDKYIVVEGNRRLAALKLLNDSELTKVRIQSINSVVSGAKYIPEEVPCIVYASREDVLDYLGYCCPFMRLLVPVDARTELFGTTRDTNLFHGNLRSRIEQLAEFLGAQTTKTMDADKRYDRIKAGDAGLDIVSFLKLDEASHIPVALAQCTCSYDEWINKQESINSDTWRTRIDPIAPFWRYMYVPFYCHNASGKFEQLTDIHTCLIDRQRILCLLDLHHELFEQLESLQLQVLINNIW